MTIIRELLFGAGVTAIITACWWVAPWLGLMVLGIAAVILSLAWYLGGKQDKQT